MSRVVDLEAVDFAIQSDRHRLVLAVDPERHSTFTQYDVIVSASKGLPADPQEPLGRV